MENTVTLCTSREKRPPGRDQPQKLPNEEGKDKGATSKERLTAVSTKNKCNILMMTARGEVSNPETLGRRTDRILFDTGSRRTYITSELKSKLKLKTHRNERIILKTCGNKATGKATEVNLKFVTKYIKKEIMFTIDLP